MLNAKKQGGVRKYDSCWLKNIQNSVLTFWSSQTWFWKIAQAFRFRRHELPNTNTTIANVVSKCTFFIANDHITSSPFY